MERKNKSKKITWQQLAPGIFLSLGISFILFFYAPIELYCSNLDEFWFDFAVLLKMCLAMFGTSLLVLLIGYVILLWIHPVVYRIGLAGGLILFLCCYVQGEFLIRDLPTLTGSDIDWNSYPGLRMGSILLWVITVTVVILLLALLRKKQQMFENVLMFVCGVMTLMLLVTAVSVVVSTDTTKKESQLYVTEKDEFSMSQDENFVILVLDTLDSREFSQLLSEDSGYQETFKDFTYFENTTGTYACTINAIPFILSGEWYEKEGSFTEHMNKVYTQSPLFAQLESRGYELGLYEDELHTQEESAISRFSNIVTAEYTVKSYTGLIKQELKLIGYRYAPFDLKRYCVTKKSGFDEEIQVECEDRGFVSRNDLFKDGLEDVGVTADAGEKQFKFIHLEGAHAPYIYDKDCNVIDESEGDYRQSVEASLTLATKYIEELQEAGTYDNTALIVMADHGYNGTGAEGDALLRPTPMLLIKGRGEQHDTLQISQAPISYVDLQDAYVRLMDGAASDAVFDWKEGDVRERRFLKDSFGQTGTVVEYLQTGYAQDLTTLIPTGREY